MLELGDWKERMETVERASLVEVKAASAPSVQSRVTDWPLLQGLSMEQRGWRRSKLQGMMWL